MRNLTPWGRPKRRFRANLTPSGLPKRCSVANLAPWERPKHRFRANLTPSGLPKRCFADKLMPPGRPTSSFQGQLDAVRSLETPIQGCRNARFSSTDPKLLQMQPNCSACKCHCRPFRFVKIIRTFCKCNQTAVSRNAIVDGYRREHSSVKC